jgi:UDPglucose 6-dehydrogenase
VKNVEERSIGVIGMGVLGGAIFHGFKLYNEVRGYDIDERKATHTFTEVTDCDYIFIQVPTPMENIEGGKADLCFLEAVMQRMCEEGYNLDATVIIKSTIPPGTTEYLQDKFCIRYLAHSPEFLTERTALIDFITPARHVIGTNSPIAAITLTELYLTRFPGIPVLTMKPGEAELVKYGANCFFATKVLYFNEIYLLADKMDLNFESIMAGIMGDGRIGKSHNQVPGHDDQLGVGGKCFPKDISALIALMKDMGITPRVLEAVWEQNKAIREHWDWADIAGAVSEENNG